MVLSIIFENLHTVSIKHWFDSYYKRVKYVASNVKASCTSSTTKNKKENISQIFRLKQVDEKINYFLKEFIQNSLMNKKHKKFCMTLNYREYFLILLRAITVCISISAFDSLFSIPIGIKSTAVVLNIFAIIRGIKNYKSLFK